MTQAATAEIGQRDETRRGAATAVLRVTMVDRQLRPFDVTDVLVLERFLAVPREAFLPPALAPLAYSDLAIRLEDGGGDKRQLLPPLHLARMLQGAQIQPGDAVLDIGGGTGYSAALLSGLAARVTMLECDAGLVRQAKADLAAAGAEGVRVDCGPLERGAPDGAPYDVILVHGRVEANLDALFAQLSPNGRLLAIQVDPAYGGQQCVRYDRSDGIMAGARPLFDAGAPILPGFAKAPAFSL